MGPFHSRNGRRRDHSKGSLVALFILIYMSPLPTEKRKKNTTCHKKILRQIIFLRLKQKVCELEVLKKKSAKMKNEIRMSSSHGEQESNNTLFTLLTKTGCRGTGKKTTSVTEFGGRGCFVF